ncbi:hypothetical protein QYQ99_26680 [Comamonas testosteroni]|uniref:hypothetical protein n=1 Tax=Comamonas testosteroni TaxID=285 RepID=UPI00265E1DA9|nr:hypothetical protein [Comamonas testosteroni]WKL15859.1 hypothetical protein QYQ99_26680 [Comamonas testosteroni]
MKIQMVHMIAGGTITLASISLALNWYSLKKFDYSFFSKQIFYISLVSSSLLLIGLYLTPKNRSQISFDLAIAAALILASISIMIWLLFVNCVATTIGFGLICSLIQVPVLLMISLIVAPILFIGGLIWFFGGAGVARPLDGKTSSQKMEEWYYNRMNPNGFYKKH